MSSRSSQPLSRLASAANALGGAVLVLRPQLLGRAMRSDAFEQPSYDSLARVYGARDVLLGAVGLAAQDPKVVRAALLLRVASDVADAVVLGTRSPNARVRTGALASTLAWAVVEVAALRRDARRR